MKVDYVDLKEILKISDQGTLALVKSLLERENIPYLMQNEVFGTFTHTAIPVRLMVPNEYVAVAQKTLKNFLS